LKTLLASEKESEQAREKESERQRERTTKARRGGRKTESRKREVPSDSAHAYLREAPRPNTARRGGMEGEREGWERERRGKKERDRARISLPIHIHHHHACSPVGKRIVFWDWRLLSGQCVCSVSY